MDRIYLLLFIVAAFVCIGWIFRAVRLYPDYRNTPLQELYGGFFWYFWRSVVKQDATQSGYLKQQIGTSRILFSKMDDQGKTAARFCAIFYSRGIMVLCYNNISGVVYGKNKDKEWHARYTGKGKTYSVSFTNPVKYLETYLLHIAHAYPDAHIETRLCFDNAVDFSQLKCDITCIHNKDILGELKRVEAPVVSDEEIAQMFDKAIGGIRS